MDILFFLKQRTDFIRRHYDLSVGPFEERKRLIDRSEPPFDDPPYSEDSEPPYLTEWLDAHTSMQLVGMSCVSLLSDALKLYLNLLQRGQLRFAFTAQAAKRLKRQFVPTYRDALGEIFATDWTDTGIDFDLIEQVMLARNRGQHGTDLTSFALTHDDRTLKNHPIPFFISPAEAMAADGGRALTGFLAPMIEVTRETLFRAIDEVEKLADWVEAHRARLAEWRKVQNEALKSPSSQPNDPTDWPTLLPRFATHLAEAADRAQILTLDDPKLQLLIEPGRLDDVDYRHALIELAKAWRNRSDHSVIYVFSYDVPVPQDLANILRNAANIELQKIRKERAFPKCNDHRESRCLYVGHSHSVESRLRDHFGFGSASTSSLHLKHWEGHPHTTLTFTAYRLAAHDKLLAQLLEEYLWDELRPLLGKRGGK